MLEGRFIVSQRWPQSDGTFEFPTGEHLASLGSEAPSYSAGFLTLVESIRAEMAYPFDENPTAENADPQLVPFLSLWSDDEVQNLRDQAGRWHSHQVGDPRFRRGDADVAIVLLVHWSWYNEFVAVLDREMDRRRIRLQGAQPSLTGPLCSVGVRPMTNESLGSGYRRAGCHADGVQVVLRLRCRARIRAVPWHRLSDV